MKLKMAALLPKVKVLLWQRQAALRNGRIGVREAKWGRRDGLKKRPTGCRRPGPGRILPGTYWSLAARAMDSQRVSVTNSIAY